MRGGGRSAENLVAFMIMAEEIILRGTGRQKTAFAKASVRRKSARRMRGVV